jgi:hypothetical protein
MIISERSLFPWPVPYPPPSFLLGSVEVTEGGTYESTLAPAGWCHCEVQRR